MPHRVLAVLAMIALVVPVGAGHAATRDWRVDGGTVTFALSPARLTELGLELAAARSTADVSPGRAIELSLEPPLHAFAVSTAPSLEFVAENGAFARFAEGVAALPVEGGLAIIARGAASGARPDPVFLYDFSIEARSAGDRFALRLRSPDPSLPFPLELRNSAYHLDAAHGILAVRTADLVISEAWAAKLRRPDLAGEPIGMADVRLEATPVGGPDIAAGSLDLARSGTGGGEFQDVKIDELYDFTSYGRTGTYPTGINGFSAATTSCNVGDIDVPWNAPMAETHPFIGLAMFRETPTALEMIGKNWMKHGFFALSSSQCTTCQNPSDGSFLGVGCSDTYGAGNNASHYYLGPRSEIDPHLGTWEACGSYFDAVPVDCERDYFGSEPNEVDHRLKVWDEDLFGGGSYFYEGAYFIADDDSLENNICWREISSILWEFGRWEFATVPGPGGDGFDCNEGALALTWGDQQWRGNIAPDDGLAILAVKVTDLGGGQWHYDYALYDRTAGRGIDELVVPVGTATISNVGFHDIDKDTGNDWSASVAGGSVTWSTTSHPLAFQEMFNFRFDADAPPTAGTAIGGIAAAGIGTSFAMDTRVPDAATGVRVGRATADFELASEPNPFSRSTRLSFSVARSQSVRLLVLDVAGRTIRTLVEGPVPAGPSGVSWDGRDEGGERVASGVYFFRLEGEEGRRTIKSTLLR